VRFQASGQDWLVQFQTDVAANEFGAELKRSKMLHTDQQLTFNPGFLNKVPKKITTQTTDSVFSQTTNSTFSPSPFNFNNNVNMFGVEEKKASSGNKVAWHWQGDNGWVQYDEETCKRLEDAYTNNPSGRCKVDDERFVDLTMMLQRRYDNESKRRKVKREDVTGIATGFGSIPKKVIAYSSDEEEDTDPVEDEIESKRRKEEEQKLQDERTEEENRRKKEKEERLARIKEIEKEKKRLQKTPSFTNSVIGLEGVLQSWVTGKRREPEQSEEKKTDISSETGKEEKSSQESSSSQKEGISTPTSTPKRRLAKRAKVNK